MTVSCPYCDGSINLSDCAFCPKCGGNYWKHPDNVFGVGELAPSEKRGVIKRIITFDSEGIKIFGITIWRREKK